MEGKLLSAQENSPAKRTLLNENFYSRQLKYSTTLGVSFYAYIWLSMTSLNFYCWVIQPFHCTSTEDIRNTIFTPFLFPIYNDYLYNRFLLKQYLPTRANDKFKCIRCCCLKQQIWSGQKHGYFRQQTERCSRHRLVSLSNLPTTTWGKSWDRCKAREIVQQLESRELNTCDSRVNSRHTWLIE